MTMSKELQELLESIKDYKMTEEEKFEQMVSFVYGNLAIDEPGISKEFVRGIVLKEWDGRLLKCRV
jgi:hypothetical protein